LSAVRAWDPDLVLLTGDVSEDASASSYARVAVRLGTLGAPVLALPGNHDDPEVMKQHFPLGPWDGPGVFELDPWLIMGLDSTGPGKISGVFSQHDLERFDASMRGSNSEHILVALHHQPVPVNSPWIDRYALEEPERFLAYLDREKRVRCVAWGHVHHAFSSDRNGVSFLGAPSSVANSLPEKRKFTLDLAGPSCRWMELGDEGAVKTGVMQRV
jgi:Icc protein